MPGTSRPSAETNRSRFGVGLGLILTPNMATSRSTSGPEPKAPLLVAITILIRPSDRARPSARVMYTVLSSLATCGRLGAATVAAAGVLFWHAASWHAISSMRRTLARRQQTKSVERQ